MNKNEFMKKYLLSDKDRINPYLAYWNNRCRQIRPIIPNQLESTVCQSGKTAQIWIQSDACRYSKMGACTCCDYFQGSRTVNQVNAFKQALEKMRADSDTIVLNTCGSVLDEAELKHNDLLAIINAIRETKVRTLVLETHICTIKDEILDCLDKNRGELDIYLEIGVETLDNDINRFILNKLPFDRHVKDAIDRIHSYNLKVTGNVMTGFPFMSRDSQIQDSYRTIRALLSYGVDFLVLFPLNIKRYTLMYELYAENLYTVVDGRILIDILLKFSPDELEYINVGWYGEPRIDIPGYKKNDMIPPYYCTSCFKDMMKLWLDYNCEHDGKKRKDLLRNMKSHNCSCNQIKSSNNGAEGIDYIQMDLAYEVLRKR